MKKFCALLLALCVLNACSVLSPSKQKLTVNSNVPGTEIYVNNIYAGTDAVTVKVNKNKVAAVSGHKKGYETAFATVSNTLSTTGILDIIGTVIFYLPAIGLFTAGAYKLEQDEISLRLEEKQPAPGPAAPAQ